MNFNSRSRLTCLEQINFTDVASKFERCSPSCIFFIPFLSFSFIYFSCHSQTLRGFRRLFCQMPTISLNITRSSTHDLAHEYHWISVYHNISLNITRSSTHAVLHPTRRVRSCLLPCTQRCISHAFQHCLLVVSPKGPGLPHDDGQSFSDAKYINLDFLKSFHPNCIDTSIALAKGAIPHLHVQQVWTLLKRWAYTFKAGHKILRRV